MSEMVMLPIKVPSGKYCWYNNVGGEHCSYFRNTDDCTHMYECIHGFGRYDLEERTNKKTGSVKKPKECLQLK